MKRSSLYFIWFLALAVVVLDQFTKLSIQQYWDQRGLIQGDEVPVIPYCLNLTLTFNRGIAFGLFKELPEIWRHIVINGATLAALVMIVYFLKNHYKGDLIAYGSMSLIVGGAIGNVIDRFWYGQVVDFIDVYYDIWHWPAFNVADSAICVGVFILLFRPTKKEQL